MADPGFIPGFIGVGVDILIHYILDQINIVRRCKKEMRSLGRLVERIKPIISQIQQYRLDLNRKKGIRNEAAAVTAWLKKLDGLLRRASAMVRECTIPSWDIISRHKTSKRITALISEINEHLEPSTLMAWASVLEGLGQIKEIIQSSASSSACTSASTSQPLIASMSFFIKEPLIVGQEIALSKLEKLVIDEAGRSPFSRIGVLGKGGSGKTLLLKTLFKRKEVRDFFSDGFFLLLTVSQSPSLPSLLKELCAQVAVHTKENRDKNMSQEAVQKWLFERMQGKRFALILDDLWEKGAELLEELGLLRLTNPSNSKVIVSSRDRRALSGMGVPEKSIITMGDLDEDDSWRLFSYHAFPYNDGNLPTNIHQGTAKVVCRKCGGLPLAIKAVGRAMAEITDAHEWELAVQRLPIAHSKDKEAVYQCLRLSYDALGSYSVNLQMCFLCLTTFREDAIIYTEYQVISLWTGEGLLARKKQHIVQCGDDSLEIGKIYVNFLADRCLIEPIERDADGNVSTFRMHDVVRDMAIQIAEVEENFYCGTGKGLTTLNENECSGFTRIFLNGNTLTSLPQSLSSPEICSLMAAYNNITELPGRLMGGMISLKVLDLSGTSITSLPDSVGHLKQLILLNLSMTPITSVPASVTNLVNLQILSLSGSRITELPLDIHKLTSLRYLYLDECRDLQCLPYSISHLASLQHLFMSGCNRMWTKKEQRFKRAASVNDLGKLTQLRRLWLSNNGEAISDGTFSSLVHIETLDLTLTTLVGLPHDITNMVNLRRFHLSCPHVVEMEYNFFQFQYLSRLRLWYCSSLEEIPHLHELKSLRQLDIVGCSKIKRFPEEFSRRGAFPLLEMFSLIKLEELEELPIIREGEMLSLKSFNVINCEALKILPESYLNIKTLTKIRVYGCVMLLENLERMEKANTKIEVVTLSLKDTMTTIHNYHRLGEMKMKMYDDFWCKEHTLFLDKMYRWI